MLAPENPGRLSFACRALPALLACCPQLILFLFAGPELLFNSDFELDWAPIASQDAAISGSMAAGWADDSTGGSNRIKYGQELQDPHSGSSSMLVNITSGIAQFYQRFPQLSPDKPYTLSVWVKAIGTKPPPAAAASQPGDVLWSAAQQQQPESKVSATSQQEQQRQQQEDVPLQNSSGAALEAPSPLNPYPGFPQNPDLPVTTSIITKNSSSSSSTITSSSSSIDMDPFTATSTLTPAKPASILSGSSSTYNLTVTFGLRMWDGAKGYYASTTASVYNDWMQLVVPVVALPGSSPLDCAFMLYTDGPGQLWVDDASMQMWPQGKRDALTISFDDRP